MSLDIIKLLDKSQAVRWGHLTLKQRSLAIEAIDHAKDFRDELGVPISITVAQLLYESKWGTRTPGNNYFGTLALPGDGWEGEILKVKTRVWHEDLRGYVSVMAPMRAYTHMRHSMSDHCRIMIQHPEVKNSCNKHHLEFLLGLHNTRFREDPLYASELSEIIVRYGLYTVDSEPLT